MTSGKAASAWAVKREEAGLRLPNFIQRHLKNPVSLKQIKTTIENRGCRVNDRPERFASYLVQAGDIVQYVPAEVIQPKILYEDEFLAVVNKPPFAVCEAEKGFLGLRLCHRLDKETSGCLLLAKTAEAESLLLTLFRLRVIKKTYLAVVDGSLKKSSGTIETPVKDKSAKTSWILEKKGKQTSLLKCFPETGRTHQIRIHLASIGHPILGDFVYGKKFTSSDTVKPERILLHAAALSFLHPFTKEWIEVSAPIPKDFFEALL